MRIPNYGMINRGTSGCAGRAFRYFMQILLVVFATWVIGAALYRATAQAQHDQRGGPWYQSPQLGPRPQPGPRLPYQGLAPQPGPRLPYQGLAPQPGPRLPYLPYQGRAPTGGYPPPPVPPPSPGRPGPAPNLVLILVAILIAALIWRRTTRRAPPRTHLVARPDSGQQTIRFIRRERPFYRWLA
jgi:hypothetical protein